MWHEMRSRKGGKPVESAPYLLDIHSVHLSVCMSRSWSKWPMSWAEREPLVPSEIHHHARE